MNFIAMTEKYETSYLEDSTVAPDWWWPSESREPRKFDAVATRENAVLLGHHAKTWLWEMQVKYFTRLVFVFTILSGDDEGS